MVRTQIQLPDELYQRAKRFAAERELSLAELVRRGVELLLARFPESSPDQEEWQLPRVDGGGLRVSLEELKDLAAEEETLHGREAT